MLIIKIEKIPAKILSAFSSLCVTSIFNHRSHWVILLFNKYIYEIMGQIIRKGKIQNPRPKNRTKNDLVKADKGSTLFPSILDVFMLKKEKLGKHVTLQQMKL